MIRNETMVYVTEIAEALGIAKETAYKIIKELNEELSKQGYVTVAGRLPRKFWEDRFYGGANALYANSQVKEVS